MKHWFLLLMLLALCLLLLPGCRAAETPVVPELILRYADNQPEDYPTIMAAKYFADLVEERTDGKIRIKIYENGQLGNEISVFEQVQFGGIDFARVSTSTLAEFVPDTEILQLPYLFADADHMWRILDGEIGDELLEMIHSVDVIGLSWFDAGARNIYTRSPVTSLEDLAGMNIRVQESDFISRMVRLWGAVPVQLAYGDVYSALQTGKIDGAENNWPSYETMQHYEVAGYYTVDEHIRIPEIQICAKHTWEQLSENDRQIILECARQSALYERQLWTEREGQARENALKNGAQEIYLDTEEKEKFKEAMMPVYEQFYADYGEEIEQILAQAADE